VVVAAAWNVAAVVLRRRAAVARTERMVAEKAPLVRDALQVQWWCARGGCRCVAVGSDEVLQVRGWCSGDGTAARSARSVVVLRYRGGRIST